MENQANDMRTIASLTTVSIGIPAYNESANIGRLLAALQKQSEERFIISEIVVVSDGSTDGTERIVRQWAAIDPRITLLADHKRRGKSARMNEIMDRATSDVLVLLDADICFANFFTIFELVYPLIENPEIMHTSGHALPILPTTVIGRMAYAGAMAWERARRRATSKLYFSEGRIRAFRRDMYLKLRFPSTSADEAYSFLFGEKFGYPFVVVERAMVRYQLPQHFDEYIKQMRRFLISEDVQSKNFEKGFVDRYYTISWGIKLRAFLEEFNESPFWSLLYAFSLPLPRLLRFFDRSDNKGVWSQIVSTKGLNL